MSLRDQIIDALLEHAFQQADVKPNAFSERVNRPIAEFLADAVLPVVEPALLAAQVDATQRADTLAGRLEEAEAALQRVRTLAQSFRTGHHPTRAVNHTTADLIDATLNDRIPEPADDGPPLTDLIGIAQGTDWQPAETDEERAQRAQATIARVQEAARPIREALARLARNSEADYALPDYLDAADLRAFIAALDQPKETQ